MTDLGERLESLRGSLTQRQFAKFIGVPLTSYTNWVIGPSSPKMEYIIQICTKLGISSDWLIGISNDQTPSHNVTCTSGSVEIGNGSSASYSTVPGESQICEICKYKRFADAFKAL